MPSPRLVTGLAIVAGTFACGASAHAATVTRDASGAVVFTAAPGEVNRLTIGAGWDAGGDTVPGTIRFSDHNPITVSAPDCALRDGTDDWVDCKVSTAGVAVALGDGDDSSQISFDLPATVPVAVAGEAGADTLTGGKEPDVLDGGDGDDAVNGQGGADTVLGGAGDDHVFGDAHEAAAADRVDGGPGVDTLDEDWTDRASSTYPDVSLTLAGGADDGRPGEGDDVRNVEKVVTHQGGSLTGTDAPEYLQAFQTTHAVKIAGGGGNDEVRASGGNDDVDGGAGDDRIDAGYGDDHITGGPGRDAIFADLAGGDCGPLWCSLPYGNDVVDARDGEVDSITCGPGEDRVVADADDVVAPDCETVDRGATATAATCTVPKLVGLSRKQARAKLAAAGCAIKVKGRGKHVKRQSVKAGKQVARATVVTVRLGR